MSAEGKRTNRTVTFTAKDQALIKTLDGLLEAEQYESFSELCKQALRRFLIDSASSQAVELFAQLQKQVLALEMRLEEKLEPRLGHCETQIAGFEGSLQDLKQQVSNLQVLPSAPEPPAAEPKPPADPLLNRLSSLLEDF